MPRSPAVHALPVTDRTGRADVGPHPGPVAVAAGPSVGAPKDPCADHATRHRALTAVVEQSADFVALFDTRLHVQYINPAGLRLLGLTSRQALDRLERPKLLDWVWPDDMAEVHERILPEVEAAGCWSGRLRFRRVGRADPGEALFRIRALSDDAGDVTAYALSAPDLGGLRAAEDALRRTGEELADANRQKDRVLARLGHELRTPMNALVNGLEIVRSGASAADQAAMLTMMTRQCGQLGSLIDDLVDVARAQSGQLRVSLSPQRLDLLVANAVEERRYETGPLGIRLSTELDEARGARAMLDEHRFRQVLNNLLGNAIRATQRSRRSGRVTVSLVIAGERIVVTVADNGCGIAPDDQARIFEPFERIGDTTDGGLRRDSGLGLGLAIARELTVRHHGDLSVSSEGVDRGACFRVELPLHDVTDAMADEAPGDASGAFATVDDDAITDRRRIVLIDDEPDASDAMRRVLQRIGHEAHRATDGPSGIALVCRVQPDLVICDIGMPGMNGFDVARALRAREGFSSTRLVALTGFADERTGREAIAAGFDEHVAKPIHGARLRELVSG